MSDPKLFPVHDAEPEAWRGEKKPDPTPRELAILAAAKRFAVLDHNLQHYAGARSGAAYEQLLADWRESRTALVAMFPDEVTA